MTLILDRRRLLPAVLLGAACAAFATGCAGPGENAAAALPSRPSRGLASAALPPLPGRDSGPITLVAPPTRRREPRPVRGPRLSPAADSIATHLVFAPKTETWFLGAARSNRLLVDLGRVDLDVRKDSLRLAAYQEAVAALSPVRPGTRLRLRGAWGAEDATVSGFDVWNGRIVATLEVSPLLDSLARGLGRRSVPRPIVVTAMRADSARGPVIDLCTRDSVPAALAARADSVRDSVARHLLSNAMPTLERLANSARISSGRVPGCFGPSGRLLLIVDLRAGGGEYIRERVVALNDSGRVIPVRMVDYRFTAHDALTALDADGDGVDDLAARGSRRNAGGIVVLRLASGSNGSRLERLASGFSWESR